MNSDFWAAFVKQFLMAFFSSAAATAYISNSQAVAISSGAGALVTLGYTLWAHYNMRKVAATAIVTGTADTVAQAKSLSTAAGK